MVASLSLLVSRSCNSCTACNEVVCSLTLHLLELSQIVWSQLRQSKDVPDLDQNCLTHTYCDDIPEMIIYPQHAEVSVNHKNEYRNDPVSAYM